MTMQLLMKQRVLSPLDITLLNNLRDMTTFATTLLDNASRELINYIYENTDIDNGIHTWK